MRRRAGFTLAELAIAIAVIGVLLAAVFLFFHSSSDTARRVARAGAAQTDARLAANQVDTFLASAGFTTVAPPGEWHPLVRADRTSVTYVNNTEEPGSFGPEDTLTIAARDEGGFVLTDASGREVYGSPSGASVEFAYLDGTGGEIPETDLATRAGLDRIRQIAWKVSAGTGEFQAALSGISTPPNLSFSGMGPEAFPSGYRDGGSRAVHFFDENWENPSTLFNEDYIEASVGWDAIRWEDFESASSWSAIWFTNRSAPEGRVQRYSGTTPHGGSYVMALDRTGPGAYVTSAGVWNVNLAGIPMTEQLRLHFWWKNFNEGWNTQDGVFFPTFQDQFTTPLFSQDFEDFGNNRNTWTYWTDTYGDFSIDTAYPLPAGGKYITLDSRRDGYASHNRLMWTMNLSAYSSNPNLQLTYYVCSRGEEYSAGNEGDFVGLAGTGGITGTPVWYQNLVLPAPGTWTPVTLDLDAVVPAGYDWSNFRILFAQYDNDRAVSATGNDGISIDNAQVRVFIQGDTLFTQKIRQTPAAWTTGTWYEQFVDLDSAATYYSRTFANPFPIAWVEYGNDAMPNDGICIDDITIEQNTRWIIPGWLDAPVSGYTLDEWYPSQHDHYPLPNTSWCWAMNGAGNYTAAPTQAYIQSPVYSLAAYPAGTRLSFSFQHKYAWAAGDGCNVRIWNQTTQTWDLIVPYWGYYTSAVPALGGEPGWTGTSSGTNWQFCVFDISDYAGKSVQFRFFYGTQGSGSADGWNVDYSRCRVGPDWPQIMWNFPSSEYADWFGWSTPPGVGDPAAAAYGTRSAGNDMSTVAPWDTYYENNLHNALISPPVRFVDPTSTYFYMQFMNCLRTESNFDTCFLEAAPFATTIADTTWRLLGSWTGSSAAWWKTRIYMNPHLSFWHSQGRCLDNMVVFRWRTWTNASNPNYGGWNVDSIKAFSSSVYLPPITTPALNGGENPVLFYPGTELPERLRAPTEPAAVLPVNDETSCRPSGR